MLNATIKTNMLSVILQNVALLSVVKKLTLVLSSKVTLTVAKV
jgi:hypothetical protein